ncbi:MAG: tRNA pseudouridine(13) synthase TruD [Candidatus Helarchaeota archaeon]
MKIFKIDKQIGLEVYSTKGKGIGGNLRIKNSDFKVSEIEINNKRLEFFRCHKDYSYLFDKKLEFISFNLQKCGLSTFEAIKRISLKTGIDINNFYYNGLKDKRGISVQKICVKCNSLHLLTDFQDNNLILFNFKKEKDFWENEHWGNHFEIIIRNVHLPWNKCKKVIFSIQGQVNKDGLLNYFGYQRFGTIRQISHLIGKEIIMNNYETALKKYLTIRSKYEDIQTEKIRKSINKDWPNIDIKILNYLPQKFDYEKEIIKKIIETNLDYENIMLSVFGRNLIELFVHAYQGYLFNKMLSSRVKDIGKKIEIGDSVIILDNLKLPSNKIVIVDNRNLDILNNLIKKKKAVLGIPLLGKNLPFLNIIMSNKYVKKIILREKVKIDELLSWSNYDIIIKGVYRPFLVFPKALKFKLLNNSDNKNNLINILTSFSIQKGTYATILLREFMKTDPLNY